MDSANDLARFGLMTATANPLAYSDRCAARWYLPVASITIKTTPLSAMKRLSRLWPEASLATRIALSDGRSFASSQSLQTSIPA